MKEFRVWSNEYKEYIGEECFISGTTGKAMMESSVDFELVEIHDAVVEFWTGKTDSEGVKIFEKDKVIVSSEDDYSNNQISFGYDWEFYGSVAMDAYHWCVVDPDDKASISLCDISQQEITIKVIGTIHEDES